MDGGLTSIWSAKPLVKDSTAKSTSLRTTGQTYKWYVYDPFALPLTSTSPLYAMHQAIKVIKRKNNKTDRMHQLRQQQLPRTPHTQLSDKPTSNENKIQREIAIMKKIRHPNVVRLIEVIDDILDEKIYLGNLSCSLGRIYPATTHSL